MRAGRMDRLIRIERKTATQDNAGQPIESWEPIGGRPKHPAYRIPVSGTERFTADQFIAREQVEFGVRYHSALADLNPLDRIVDPPSSEPSDHEIYDILSVSEIGRREGFRIITARRGER